MRTPGGPRNLADQACRGGTFHVRLQSEVWSSDSLDKISVCDTGLNEEQEPKESSASVSKNATLSSKFKAGQTAVPHQ